VKQCPSVKFNETEEIKWNECANFQTAAELLGLNLAKRLSALPSRMFKVYGRTPECCLIV